MTVKMQTSALKIDASAERRRVIISVISIDQPHTDVKPPSDWCSRASVCVVGQCVCVCVCVVLSGASLSSSPGSV